MDAYSTRTVQVRAKERELARAWEAKHGRAPTSRELLYIANDATLQSRRGKDPGPVDWDALAARWDATLGGELADVAPAVSNARGPGAQATEHHGGHAPTGPPTRQAQARALAKALILVSAKHPAWTRHDLVKQLALVLAAETRHMGPQAAQELLAGLAEEALSGGHYPQRDSAATAALCGTFTPRPAEPPPRNRGHTEGTLTMSDPSPCPGHRRSRPCRPSDAAPSL